VWLGHNLSPQVIISNGAAYADLYDLSRMMPKDAKGRMQDAGEGMDITIYIKIKNEWLKHLC
jgi:hypothetical protein